MDKLKCPDCGAQQFYAKDPEDQYNISSFNLEDGKIEYLDASAEEDHIPVSENTEIFCERCAWHDKLKILK